VRDAIELRGILEGTAARFAAEQSEPPAALDALRRCSDSIDRLLRRWKPGIGSFAKYVERNAQFHALLLEAAGSPMLQRSMKAVSMLPFASANAFVFNEAETEEGRDILSAAQVQHRAIVESITNREGVRAESLAREHSRLARNNLDRAMRHQRLTRLPGSPLIKFPHSI